MISRAGSIICIALLLGTLGLTTNIKRHVAITPTPKLSQLPLAIGEWSGEDSGAIDIAARETLQLDQFIRRIYRRVDGATVFLYVGYWHRQTGDHQAAKHSPALCLPANGWSVQHTRRITLPDRHSPILVNSLIAERSTKRFEFIYWFFSGADSYAEEWLTLLKVSFGILAGKRPDGGLIEISIPLGMSGGSGDLSNEESIREFASLVAPEITKLMSTTSGSESP